MTITIGRRELLAALGGAAAAWPLAARAQQPDCPPLAFPLARRNGQAARTANAIPTNEAPARTRFALLLSGVGLRRMWHSR
jgi:hypothetical protein